jgi:PleD family two-component response regulator
MTISVGVCNVTQARDVEYWFELADAALYQAKRNGHNQIELAAVPIPEPNVPLTKILPDWR